MPTTPVGNEPVKVVDINDPQGIVYNRSTTVTVFFGSTASLCNRADASILDPNATVAVDTDAEVWCVAPTLTGSNTVTVDYQPHGAAYFRGLTAALGMLVLQSVFSPNFLTGVSGWSINKDGSAEFNNLTIRGTFLGTDFIINSAGLFLYNGTPALGNLVGSWTVAAGADSFGNAYRAGLNIDATVGTSYLQLLPGNPAILNIGTGDSAEATPAQYNSRVVGSGPTRYILSDLKAPRVTGENASAIAEVQLFSPTVDLSVPPGVNVTANDGTNLGFFRVISLGAQVFSGDFFVGSAGSVGLRVTQSATGEADVFSPKQTVGDTPAELALLSALQTGAFPLAHLVGSNLTVDGITTLASTLVLDNEATPSTAASAASVYANTGQLKYVGSDGVDYATGRVTSHAANGGSGQTISAVTFTAITGMTVNVGVNLYKFRIVVDLTTAAAAGRWELQLSTTGVTSTTDYEFFWKSGAGVVGGAVHQTSITTTQIGPNPSVIGPYSAVYEGIVRFTTAGTLTVTAATTVAADTFTVWDGSTIDLEVMV